MTKLDKCPTCGSSLYTYWVTGRQLQQECEAPDCTWKGRPFLPKKKPVRSVKTVDNGGWVYQGFDQRGYSFILSGGFSSKKACIQAARREIRKASEDPSYGKCVAIVWPPVLKIRGIRVR